MILHLKVAPMLNNKHPGRQAGWSLLLSCSSPPGCCALQIVAGAKPPPAGPLCSAGTAATRRCRRWPGGPRQALHLQAIKYSTLQCSGAPALELGSLNRIQCNTAGRLYVWANTPQWVGTRTATGRMWICGYVSVWTPKTTTPVTRCCIRIRASVPTFPTHVLLPKQAEVDRNFLRGQQELPIPAAACRQGRCRGGS